MAGLRVEQYVVGPVMTNCYFAVNEGTKEMLIVDPGDSAGMLIHKIKERAYPTVTLPLTHRQLDHAGAA